ncbi:MAG: DUF4065 domain-containing protein [Planctomycetaceae bacterium]|nr:DUF4065 domain-containing protein [Planctomycetaceae bacterium]
MTPKSPPDITVFDIADWFLAQATEENKPPRHMKLQKLVYFAYGWYYAYFDQPLFSETIYAWRYGPVVKALYDGYKHFKGNPIVSEITIVRPKLDNEVARILRYVWELYAACTDMQLSEITHRLNAPWHQTYKRDEWIPYEEIAPELIRDYFKSIKIKNAESLR